MAVSNLITFEDKAKAKDSGLPIVNTIRAVDVTEIKTKHNALAVNVLQKDQTDGFTPTNDNHPATKKYVDDSSGASVNRVNSSSYSNRAKIPLVSFIDDDGRREAYDLFKVTLDFKGIKAGFAIACDKIGTPTHMTPTEVKTLVSEGHELINHCSGYVTMTALTEAQNREELRNCNEKLKQWGSEKRGFVYPASAYNDEVIAIVREYCNFAYGINGLPIVGDAIPPFTLTRIAIGDFRTNNPATINGVAEGNTLAYFKAAVDWAKTNNAWLTFACHSWDTLYNDTIVRDLIDYIGTEGIDIVLPSTGYAMHGSSFTVGDGEEDNLTINKHGVHRDNVNILHEFNPAFYFKTTDVNAAFTFPFFSSSGDRINWKATGGDGDDDFNQWITTNPVFDFGSAGTKTVTAYNDTFLDTILQFRLDNSNLTEINVTTLRNLNSLKVFTNAALTELSLKNLNKLTVLHLYGCDVKVLDLRDCHALTQLWCQNNADLARLDFSYCPDITNVTCQGTSVQKLDFTMCPNLSSLIGVPSTLIEVDIRGCSLDSSAQDAFLNAVEALGTSYVDIKMRNQAGGLLRTSASDADHAALLGRNCTIDVS